MKLNLSRKTKSLLTLAGLTLLYVLVRNPTDPKQNSVTITNRERNHGGTGTILSSSKNGSLILTNVHVCKGVGDGGVVNGTHEIQKYIESQVSDLCLVYVSSNLHQQTRLASSEPSMFDKAMISGHPALMPTVLTYGHFSDKAIISVMTEFKACTADDLNDPNKMVFCVFFGGIPVIKSYESILVTATIMPGSSGSGIYNSSNKLTAVVFAGQGDIGYAWSVPFDQVREFLTQEVPNNPNNWKISDKSVNVMNQGGDTKKLADGIRNCSNAVIPAIVNVCKVLTQDVRLLK